MTNPRVPEGGRQPNAQCILPKNAWFIRNRSEMSVPIPSDGFDAPDAYDNMNHQWACTLDRATMAKL